LKTYEAVFGYDGGFSGIGGDGFWTSGESGLGDKDTIEFEEGFGLVESFELDFIEPATKWPDEGGEDLEIA
jgi:hypothetical protein